MTTSHETQTIGMVGLGQMGGAMARRLASRSYPVFGFDVSDSARLAAGDGGVQVLDSVAAVAESCDVIMLSLPSPAVVREVVLGSEGILSGPGPSCVIDLSTTGFEVSVEIGRALSAAGLPFIDAPVSGGVAGAVDGTLTIMASAPAETLDRQRQLLEVLGAKIFHVGTGPGLGQVMKLVNNMISSVAMIATAEGMVVGTRAGLDPATMLEVLNASSGRNSHTEVKFPKHVLPRTFDFGFQMNLLYKDVRLGLELAQDLGIPMVVTSNASQMWNLAIAEAGGDQDMTAIVKHLERWAGIEVANDSSSRKEKT